MKSQGDEFKENVEVDVIDFSDSESSSSVDHLFQVQVSEASSLEHLSDDQLLSDTELVAAKSREITTALLAHLGEIDRRRLFARAGCSSLFDYCVRVLKMSEPQASRRVSAARALREFPEIESKLNSGALTLSAISQVQTFFRNESKTSFPVEDESRREILQAVEGKSARETEKLLLSRSSKPESFIRERVRQITQAVTEVRCVLDEETMSDLQRLKEIWSHELPEANHSQLIKKSSSYCREKLDPLSKALRAASPAPEKQRANPGRYIPSAVRQEVWLRDKGECTYVDKASGRRCGSRVRVQVDHILPYGKGGPTTPDNLRLLCFVHNQQHARDEFDPGQRHSPRIWV